MPTFARTAIAVVLLSCTVAGSAAGGLLSSDAEATASPATAPAAGSGQPTDVSRPSATVAAAPVAPRRVTKVATPQRKATAPKATSPKATLTTRRTAPKPSAPKATVTEAVSRTPRADGCDGRGNWVERRGAYALRQISYRWRSLGYTIRFLPAKAGYLGMAYASPRRIDIYVRSCAKESNTLLAFSVAHEIGHAIDFVLGSPEWHARWKAARGIAPKTPWFTQSGVSDYGMPAGDWAETFAVSEVPAGTSMSRWGRPSASKLARLLPALLP